MVRGCGAGTPRVSVVIPTWNRRGLVSRAIDSVLAQDCAVEEIIVVDDGSTDGTGDALQARYGDRIRYYWQPNAGVSAARNTGLAMSRGRYLALLDSDDLWMPDKTRLQADWLDAHPSYGMVVCDVARVDRHGRDIDVLHRRRIQPEDGWASRWIMHDPVLVPASVMLRREVVDDVGGFDETLATAEDLEFHLRVARRWRIGVVARPLVRAMRGHDGLSALASSYDDYVAVVERSLEKLRGQVDEPERLRALAGVYASNARGVLLEGRWKDAWRLALRAWRTSDDLRVRRRVLGLAGLGGRRVLARALRS